MIFLWPMLYSLVYTISNKISRGSTSFVMLVYLVALLGWLIMSGYARRINLCTVTPIKHFYFIPLMVLPLYNLFNLLVAGCDFELGNTMILLIAAVTEEIYFRGFLLSFLLRRNKNRRSAIWISSTAFALFHCTNFVLGIDSAYVLIQVLCAFSLGVCYGAVTILCKSIVPCILAHVLVNFFGAGSDRLIGLGMLICILVQIVFGLWLTKIKFYEEEIASC